MEQTFKSLIILLLIGECFCTWYKVLMINGLGQPGLGAERMRKSIALNYPQTNPVMLTSPLGIKTPSVFACMWDIVASYQRLLPPIMEANPQGIVLIGLSQGALVARALASTIPNHNIVKIISVGGPHMGVFNSSIDRGIDKIADAFERVKLNVKKLVVPHCKFWYPIQCLISMGGFWREPDCLEDYMKKNKFLPVLNNEVQHKRSEEFKNNFLKISQLILISSNTDGIQIPWQTGQFGTINSPHSEITPMRQQEVYLNDTFGLQTLDQRGGIILHRADGCTHMGYLSNETVWQKFIFPHLVPDN